MKLFSELLFPVDISYGMTGGPEYSTNIVQTKNGQEQRNTNWQRPRYRYNVGYSVRSAYQLEALIAFFHLHKGRAIGFRFKDWFDYKVINQRIKVENKQIQLVKNYQTGDLITNRIITKPVINSLKITHNDIEIKDYVVNYTNGKIILNKEIQDVMVDFEFDVPVRFDVDKLDITMDSYDLYSCQDINLVEIL